MFVSDYNLITDDFHRKCYPNYIFHQRADLPLSFFLTLLALRDAAMNSSQPFSLSSSRKLCETHTLLHSLSVCVSVAFPVEAEFTGWSDQGSIAVNMALPCSHSRSWEQCVTHTRATGATNVSSMLESDSRSDRRNTIGFALFTQQVIYLIISSHCRCPCCFLYTGVSHPR